MMLGGCRLVNLYRPYKTICAAAIIDVNREVKVKKNQRDVLSKCRTWVIRKDDFGRACTPRGLDRKPASTVPSRWMMNPQKPTAAH